MYRIELNSQYEELYRYNIILTCGGYDAEGEQLYVNGVERIYSEEIVFKFGKEITPPLNFKVGEPITLECDDAHSIRTIAYVITNTLPTDRDINNSPPLPLQITITKGDEVIYDTVHDVNQWGGATIEIKI